MAHPIRFTVNNGVPVTWMSNYFSPNTSLSFVPTGGASMVVTATLDDPNAQFPHGGDPPAYTPVFFPITTAPFNAAITTNVLASLSLFPFTALLFTVSVGGSCIVTIVQPTDGSGSLS